MKRLLAVFLVLAGLSLSVLEAVHRHDADLSDHCEACCVSQNAVVAPATAAPIPARVEFGVPLPPSSPALCRDASSPARAARGPPLSWS